MKTIGEEGVLQKSAPTLPFVLSNFLYVNLKKVEKKEEKFTFQRYVSCKKITQQISCLNLLLTRRGGGGGGGRLLDLHPQLPANYC